MSILTIRIQTAALDELQAKAAKLGKEPEIALAGARAAANLTRQHLFNLDARSPGSHFYSAAAKSVEEPVIEGQGAAFMILKVGLAQRYFGGHIEAGKGTSSFSGGPTKYLAIPARDEAQGKTPGEFDDLVFVPRGNDKAMLLQALQTSLLGAGGRRLKKPAQRAEANTRGGLVMFWLVTSVDQQADPTVLPADVDLAEAARNRMDNYLSGLLGTGSASGGAGGAN